MVLLGVAMVLLGGCYGVAMVFAMVVAMVGCNGVTRCCYGVPR